MVDLSRGEEYLASAEADLRLVQALLPRIREFPEAVCFHCEQAAEKLLKQMWLEEGFVPRKTHDLTDLLGVACERGWVRPTKEEAAAAAFLNAYATKFRYIQMRESEKGEAQEVVVCLNEVAAMLERNGYPSASVETRGRLMREEVPPVGEAAEQARALVGPHGGAKAGLREG